MKLRVTHDTVFKPGPLQSDQYSSNDIVRIEKGRVFDVHSYAQDKKGHLRVALLNTKLGPEKKNTWTVFEDHVSIERAFPFKLAVPYYSQRDNQNQPWRTCNTSAHAMLIEFLKPSSIKGSDDFYWTNYVSPRGDTTVHSVHTAALKSLGIESEWRTNLSYADLDNQLARSIPIPIAVLHRGTLQAPTGGHIIVVIGKKSPDEYICLDPFGEGFGSNYERNPNGKDVVYPKASLDHRWSAGYNGWGRIVSSY